MNACAERSRPHRFLRVRSLLRVNESESGEREFWDRRADAWERRADSLNRFSDTYGIPVIDALNVRPGERVLDIGCGPGTTAIELARRVAPDGEVVGVDISDAMTAAAQRRATREQVPNITFRAADAESGALGEKFDAAYSRFGVMFFTDATRAFANIGRALRAGGRLGCAVWGSLAENPWMFVPTLAAAPVLQAELTIPAPDEPGPFSLADPERVSSVLTGAGFEHIAVELIEGARLVTSASAADDVQTLLEVGPLGEAYQAADDNTRQQAVDSVIAALAPYLEEDGWRLPGAALQVTARRPLS